MSGKCQTIQSELYASQLLESRKFNSGFAPALCPIMYADALQLAGADYLVVGPKVLEQLNKEYTMQGYNDGKSLSQFVPKQSFTVPVDLASLCPLI